MAKGKLVTAEEVGDVLDALDEISGRALDIVRRIGNGHLGDIPDAGDHARLLVAISRNLLDLSLRMSTAQSTNDMKAERVRIVNELKATAPEKP